MHRSTARHVLPEFTERTDGGIRTLDPYAKLFSERIVLLGTAVDDAAANDVTAQLMYLEHAAPDRDVSLYVNSPGGSFSAMCAIYDSMRYIRCDVEVVCLGQAASAAAVLLAAGTPGKRMVLPHARVLIHQPALAEPVRGTPSDLTVQADELLRAHEKLVGMLALHTGRDPERIRADLERDTFLDAPAAVAYGLADRVVVSRDASLAPHGTR
ncbi:ATP-dependent Clp protease proteolytic subunit [Streptomyces cinnamoneus]|uniref:ATP-dependent Clp protease proteolytic subunit n=1 Tax=Streptomyces cinnamoneus TaxID=53446 RepID=A0A2G1XLM2_STRCJ|nr:ATP-dependent Clp protease proteolytic subunit [Streptomyces cinnamoneus]PHQ52081.1 ATP-dependent Clp protease proteolytic subunit [Streptomyces cinnamoneus]PPT16161.1 ATP-dependent Clp protease proteolytic subunit [Streptomyces cinnamoneus]